MKFGGPDKGEKEEIEFFKLNKYLLNIVHYEELFTKNTEIYKNGSNIQHENIENCSIFILSSFCVIRMMIHL